MKLLGIKTIRNIADVKILEHETHGKCVAVKDLYKSKEFTVGNYVRLKKMSLEGHFYDYSYKVVNETNLYIAHKIRKGYVNITALEKMYMNTLASSPEFKVIDAFIDAMNDVQPPKSIFDKISIEESTVNPLNVYNVTFNNTPMEKLDLDKVIKCDDGKLYELKDGSNGFYIKAVPVLG